MAALVDKLTDSSHLRAGFLQSVGALPIEAAAGTVGLLCGVKQAQAMTSYVRTAVRTVLSGQSLDT